MNDTINYIKITIIAMGAGLTAWLGNLAIPVYILIMLNLIDYITGLMACTYRGETRNSKRGMQGMLKKMSMWVLVGLGAVVDWLLVYAVATLGVVLPFDFLAGILVAVWLICNEIISIIENIDDIGVSVPFLNKIIKTIRGTIEDKMEVPGFDDDGKNEVK